MNNIVTNKELSKKFAEAGLDVESEFYWSSINTSEPILEHKRNLMKKVGNEEWTYLEEGKHRDDVMQAYLLSELLSLFPENFELEVYSKNEDGECEIWPADGIDRKGKTFIDKNPANAAAKLLLWLIENDHVDVNKLNQN